MKSPNVAITRNYGIYIALIPAIIIIAAWTFGISSKVRDVLDPPIPQWVVVILISATIIGLLMVFLRVLRTSIGQTIAKIFLACFIIPILATVFGGVYWWISDRFARNRETLATMILGVGLGTSVFGFGIATEMEVIHMSLIFSFSLVGLVGIRILSRPGSVSLILFGALHFVTLFAAMIVASIEDQQRRTPELHHPVTHTTHAEQSASCNPLPAAVFATFIVI